MKECRLLGLITIYNPDTQAVISNILRFIDGVDQLIVWDNTPSDQIKQQMMPCLAGWEEKIVWHGTGENTFIAPAINYAWQWGQARHYDLLLVMDQDSQFEDFQAYRREVEEHYQANEVWVYTPYIHGLDVWQKHTTTAPRRLFINSGTIIPFTMLDAINGVDETFLLDALDHDTALRIIKRGYKIVSLTAHDMNHTMGQPHRSSFLGILTPYYPPERIHSIVRSHIINYRKNRQWMTAYEKRRFFKEFIFWTLFRILFIERGKRQRLKMFRKGVSEGLKFNLSLTKP